MKFINEGRLKIPEGIKDVILGVENQAISWFLNKAEDNKLVSKDEVRNHPLYDRSQDEFDIYVEMPPFEVGGVEIKFPATVKVDLMFTNPGSVGIYKSSPDAEEVSVYDKGGWPIFNDREEQLISDKYIGVNLNEAFRLLNSSIDKSINLIRTTIRHEFLHYIQDVASTQLRKKLPKKYGQDSWKLSLNNDEKFTDNFGYPSKKRTKGLRRPAHALRPEEFYTRLNDEIFYIERAVKSKGISNTKELKDEIRSTLLNHTFFTMLKKHKPGIYKKAAKIFVSEILQDEEIKNQLIANKHNKNARQKLNEGRLKIPSTIKMVIGDMERKILPAILSYLGKKTFNKLMKKEVTEHALFPGTELYENNRDVFKFMQKVPSFSVSGFEIPDHLLNVRVYYDFTNDEEFSDYARETNFDAFYTDTKDGESLIAFNAPAFKEMFEAWFYSDRINDVMGRLEKKVRGSLEHEFIHHLQFVGQQIIDPEKGINTFGMPSKEKADEEHVKRHEIRPEEFFTRLNDLILDFKRDLSGSSVISEEELRGYTKMKLGRSHWLKFLKRKDRGKYKKAIKLFVQEIISDPEVVGIIEKNKNDPEVQKKRERMRRMRRRHKRTLHEEEDKTKKQGKNSREIGPNQDTPFFGAINKPGMHDRHGNRISGDLVSQNLDEIIDEVAEEITEAIQQKYRTWHRLPNLVVNRYSSLLKSAERLRSLEDGGNKEFSDEYVDALIDLGLDDAQFQMSSFFLKDVEKILSFFKGIANNINIVTIGKGESYMKTFLGNFVNDHKVQRYLRSDGTSVPLDQKELKKVANYYPPGTVEFIKKAVRAERDFQRELSRTVWFTKDILAKIDEAEARRNNRTSRWGGEPTRTEDIEVLYHATINADSILKNGFQREIPKQAGLGGSPTAKKGVSFTADPYVALKVAKALKIAISIANGKLRRRHLLSWAKQEGILEKVDESGRLRREDEGAGNNMELFKNFLQFSEIEYNPAFIGAGEDLVEIFEGRNPSEVKVIKAKVNLKHPDISWFRGMDEYRVPPEAIVGVIGTIEDNETDLMFEEAMRRREMISDLFEIPKSLRRNIIEECEKNIYAIALKFEPQELQENNMEFDIYGPTGTGHRTAEEVYFAIGNLTEHDIIMASDDLQYETDTVIYKAPAGHYLFMAKKKDGQLSDWMMFHDLDNGIKPPFSSETEAVTAAEITLHQLSSQDYKVYRRKEVEIMQKTGRLPDIL